MLNTIKGEFGKERLRKIKEKLENKLKKVNARMEEFAKEESNATAGI